MNSDLQRWFTASERGTSGDMVSDILSDWNKSDSDLQSKITIAGAEIERCYKLLYGMRCVYCGTVVGAELKSQTLGDELLRAHVEQCEKHPAFQLQSKLTLAGDALKLVDSQFMADDPISELILKRVKDALAQIEKGTK